jgi:hypothetical protein
MDLVVSGVARAVAFAWKEQRRQRDRSRERRQVGAQLLLREAVA